MTLTLIASYMARRCLVQDELNKTSECRRQIDDQLDEVRGVFTDKQKLLTCERKRSDDLRAELENISLRLFYLDNAKNDVRSVPPPPLHTHTHARLTAVCPGLPG